MFRLQEIGVIIAVYHKAGYRCEEDDSMLVAVNDCLLQWFQNT